MCALESSLKAEGKRDLHLKATKTFFPVVYKMYEMDIYWELIL